MLTQFICFNQDVNKGRSRQSIAHEIVHIWLERPSSEDPFETEAECLTAYLLASIPIIITAKRCIRAIQVVQNHFKINQGRPHHLGRYPYRCNCENPGFDYEYRVIRMSALKGGGYLEGAKARPGVNRTHRSKLERVLKNYWAVVSEHLDKINSCANIKSSPIW